MDVFWGCVCCGDETKDQKWKNIIEFLVSSHIDFTDILTAEKILKTHKNSYVSYRGCFYLQNKSLPSREQLT